jgi:hypothetical protein
MRSTGWITISRAALVVAFAGAAGCDSEDAGDGASGSSGAGASAGTGAAGGVAGSGAGGAGASSGGSAGSSGSGPGGSAGASGTGTGGAGASAGTGGSGAGGSGGDAGGGTNGASGSGGTNGASGSGGTNGASGSGGTNGASGTGGTACESWVITYTITGKFNITATPLGLGDVERDIGPGELAIRFKDGGSGPVAGAARLLAYRMPMKFSVATAGLTVTTDVVASGARDECGRAAGTLTGTTLAWAACNYSSSHGTADWIPDNAASGAGCIREYHTQGIVNCNDQSTLASCSQGNLQDGDNTQNETFNQPLNSFVFNAGLSSFQMRAAGGPSGSDDKGVETPNRAPGRTFFNLDGTEKGREKVPAPACACP